MLKKTLGLGLVITVVMLLGVFGLTGCNTGNNDLVVYKAEGKARIEAYIATKSESDYSSDNWDTVLSAAVEGKMAVDKATRNAEVDAAVSNSKAKINRIEKEELNLEWSNNNSVYAFVKAGYENDIISDPERAFAGISFQKVYVAEKNINEWTPLTLLFILEERGEASQREFCVLLNLDERIEYTSNCRDLPFDSIDTRYIERKKDTIRIGEKLTLEAKGCIDYYVKPFNFEGILVKPTLNKTYTLADFPQVDLKSVETRDNGWLFLELSTAGYFEVIKTIDTLSKLSTIEKADTDKSDVVAPPPPIWQITNRAVADFANENDMYNHNQPLVIIGKKTGSTTVSINGVSCEITIK